MKLHHAIKDQEMKHPALANALLDLGKFFVTAALLGILYAAVWGPGYSVVATELVIALVTGSLAVGISGRIAKLRRFKLRKSRTYG